MWSCTPPKLVMFFWSIYACWVQIWRFYLTQINSLGDMMPFSFLFSFVNCLHFVCKVRQETSRGFEGVHLIWAHNMINRTCKHDLTGHSTRREKEMQTEKEMERLNERMDKFKVECTSKGWKREGWRKVVAWSSLLSQPPTAICKSEGFIWHKWIV